MPNQQTVGRHRDSIILNTGKRTFMFFGRSFVVHILHLSSHYLWYCVKIYHWIRMFYSISQLIKNESCNNLEILAVLAISVCHTMPKVCLCISLRPTVANSCTNQCEWHRLRMEAIFSFEKKWVSHRVYLYAKPERFDTMIICESMRIRHELNTNWYDAVRCNKMQHDGDTKQYGGDGELIRLCYDVMRTR